MGLLSLVLCDLNLTPLPQEWAIEQILSATIVMEELDQFSPHSITVSGSFRQSLALLTGITAVQVIDDEVGTIAYGLIDDPEEQITASDQHTITLQLPNITEVLRYSTTGQGWIAGYVQPIGGIPPPHGTTFSGPTLATIINRIGALRYGWSARCVDFGDVPYVLRFEDATILGALLQTADAVGAHARQGHDPDGTPNRSIELGIFGASPLIEILTPDGGNAQDILANNANARLVQTITRHPADCTKLTNVMTPLGGGSGTSQVRFRRLFRILYDPTYEHYQSKNPRGINYYFPEYDSHFPIPALVDYSATPARLFPARPMKGNSTQWEFAVRLDGGADGYEYCIVNQASLDKWNAQYPGSGEFRSPFTDSSFTYVDSNIFNQELSERALYVAAKAQLQWYGTPQQSVTVTTVGTRRPPRAGDRVKLNVQMIGFDPQGAFPEIDEEGAYYVVAVSRSYGDVVTDTWTLTSNGKHPPDATSRSGDATRGMIEALRLIPTTTPAIYPLDTGRVKIDAAHPLTKNWEIPASTFRVQQAKILVTIFAVRHDLNQAHKDGEHQHDVGIPQLTGTVTIKAVDETTSNAQQFLPQFQHGHTSASMGNQGSQGIGVGANQWGHNHGSSVAATGGGTVGSANVPNLGSHFHHLTAGSGGDPIANKSPPNTPGILYTTNTGVLQADRLGAVMSTSSDISFVASQTNHSHGTSVPTTGGGAVSGNNLNNPALGTDGYAGLKPSVDNSGTGWTPRSYYPGETPFVTVPTTTTTTVGNLGAQTNGGHTHTLDPGIYETSFSYVRVLLEINAQDSLGWQDLGAGIGWDGTTSMTNSLDITRYVEQASGKVVMFRLTGLSDATGAQNPTGLTEVEMSGFGVLELSGVGSQVLT
jgi:hypothetical protein